MRNGSESHANHPHPMNKAFRLIPLSLLLSLPAAAGRVGLALLPAEPLPPTPAPLPSSPENSAPSADAPEAVAPVDAALDTPTPEAADKEVTTRLQLLNEANELQSETAELVLHLRWGRIGLSEALPKLKELLERSDETFGQAVADGTIKDCLQGHARLRRAANALIVTARVIRDQFSYYMNAADTPAELKSLIEKSLYARRGFVLRSELSDDMLRRIEPIESRLRETADMLNQGAEILEKVTDRESADAAAPKILDLRTRGRKLHEESMTFITSPQGEKDEEELARAAACSVGLSGPWLRVREQEERLSKESFYGSQALREAIGEAP